MKTRYLIAFFAGALLAFLLSDDSANEPKPSITESVAMGSLGYEVVQNTKAYPIDPYAMPEPFSSEPIVSYSDRKPRVQKSIIESEEELRSFYVNPVAIALFP